MVQIDFGRKLDNKYRFDPRHQVVGYFHATKKGVGFVQPEEDMAGDDMFIAQRDTLGALNGDKVSVKVVQDGFNIRNVITEVLEHRYTEAVGIVREEKNKVFVVPNDNRLPEIKIGKKHVGEAKADDMVVARFISYGDGVSGPTGAITEILGNKDVKGVDISAIVRERAIPVPFTQEEMAQASTLANREETSLSNTLASKEEMAETSSTSRADLRDHFLITIDEAGTKDIDDAISLEPNADGGWELGVHIADASYFIKEGTPLDQAARQRGTSVYLPDRIIPMLPSQLSTGVCSLHAGEDKLAISVLMDVSKEGKITGAHIAPSVIRVSCNLDYPRAQALLDTADKAAAAKAEGAQADSVQREAEAAHDTSDAALTKNLVSTLLAMRTVGQKLEAQRRARGEVAFELPDVKIILDDNGFPTSILAEEENDASRMISDFMIAANETVAQAFVEKDLPCIFRVHEGPDAAACQALRSLANTLGYTIEPADRTQRKDTTAQGESSKAAGQAGTADTTSESTASTAEGGADTETAASDAVPQATGAPALLTSSQLQSLLDQAKGTEYENLMTLCILRSMSHAHYEEVCGGHYGLAAQYYCHFTSPIRRYPDLIVHRLIHEYKDGRLDASRMQQYRQALGEITKHCSEMEHRAAACEREADRWKILQYLSAHLGEEADGIISGINKWGFFVQLPDTSEGHVDIQDLKDDRYELDEENYCLRGDKTGKTYRLGDTVHIQIAAVDLAEKSAAFVLK